MWSQRKTVRQPRDLTSDVRRRSFLGAAGASALGGAVAAFGLARPASAHETKATHPQLDPATITPDYSVYCCNLAYQARCTIDQETNGCSNGWSWTCCAYVGSTLTRVTCGECYDAECSWYAFYSSC
jgi:hypothetical protein